MADAGRTGVMIKPILAVSVLIVACGCTDPQWALEEQKREVERERREKLIANLVDQAVKRLEFTQESGEQASWASFGTDLDRMTVCYKGWVFEVVDGKIVLPERSSEKHDDEAKGSDVDKPTPYDDYEF